MPAAEIHDVADGLWAWRTAHPAHIPGEGWDPLVTSTHARTATETIVIDPLAPPPDDPAWERIEAAPPTVVVVLKPDHVRDTDLFVRRWGARAYGPATFYPDGVPRTAIEPVEPGATLPGGVRTLYDGRGRGETPVHLSEHRALVFADALTAPAAVGHELRVWSTPWHEQRTLPALTALLELDFAHVIVSHGAPVHDRAAFERALTLPPWTEP